MSSRKKERYHTDPAYRAAHLNRVARYEGRTLRHNVPTATYRAAQVCELAGISDSTLDKLIRIGLIPPQTYPSRFRVYWRHQVLLIMALVKKMREDGWPATTPHIVGDPVWQSFLKKMQTDWCKEKNHGEGTGG